MRPSPRKSGSRNKTTASPKKRPKMMLGDENEDVSNSSNSNSESPQSVTMRRSVRRVNNMDTNEKPHVDKRGQSPTSRRVHWVAHPVDLMSNKKMYRAPFKVHLMGWNPRMDLLALVSDKGEVCLKRQGWKTTWKLNVNSEEKIIHDFPFAKDGEKKAASPSCLAWSPDGMILSIGMNNGHYHMIDAEAGILRFTWSLRAPIVKMTWQSLSPDETDVEFDGSSRLEDEDNYALASCDEPKEERVLETVYHALELDTVIYPRSLYQTVLTVILEEDIIVMLGGVMCVANLNFNDYMMEKFGVAVLSICDAHINVQGENHELIVLYSGGAGTVPIRTGNTYGTHQGAGPHVEKLTSSKGERHNQIVGIELTVMKLLGDRLWLMTERFVRMYIDLLTLIEQYDMLSTSWKNESQKLNNRFSGCGFAFGEALISQILAGVSSDTLFQWVDKKLGTDGAIFIRGFFTKENAELIERTRSTLMSSVFALTHQLSRFEDEARLVFDDVIDPLSLLLGDCEELRMNEGDEISSENGLQYTQRQSFQLDSHFFKSLNVEPMHQLTMVLRQLVVCAEINGYEIGQIGRWLSLLNPILKLTKKQVMAVRNCRKFYVSELMVYILNTFVTPEYQDEFRQLLFEGNFILDEDYVPDDEDLNVLRALPDDSMMIDEWLKTAKQKGPIPYNILTRDRYFYRQSMVTKRLKHREQQQADFHAQVQYVHLGMNCPNKSKKETRLRPLPSDISIPPSTSSIHPSSSSTSITPIISSLLDGPATNTRSHNNAAALARSAQTPIIPNDHSSDTPNELSIGRSETVQERGRRSMAKYASSPETVKNKLKQLAKDYVAGKGQYPKMKKTDGNEIYDVDKVVHFFVSGKPLPENVQRLLRKNMDEGPITTTTVPDAISAVVKSINNVHTCLTKAAMNPFVFRWAHELLHDEGSESIEEGSIRRWKWARLDTKDSAENTVAYHHRLKECNTEKLLKEVISIATWSPNGIWLRTLFPVSDDVTDMDKRNRLQTTLKIKHSESGDRIMSVSLIGGEYGMEVDEEIENNERRRIHPSTYNPSISPSVGGGGGSMMQPLGIQIDDDSTMAAVIEPGQIIEFKKVFTMNSATTMAIAVFDNEQGKRQRLVQINPYMEHEMYIHEDILRTEIYENFEISRDREMGAALSEGGTRVTWFELKDKTFIRSL